MTTLHREMKDSPAAPGSSCSCTRAGWGEHTSSRYAALDRQKKPRPMADEETERLQTHVGGLALTYLEHETPVYVEPSDTFIPAPPVSSVPPDTVLLVLAVRRPRFGSAMALVLWDGGVGWARFWEIGVLC